MCLNFGERMTTVKILILKIITLKIILLGKNDKE